MRRRDRECHRSLPGRTAGILDLQLPRARPDRLELRTDARRGAVTGIEADQRGGSDLGEHRATVASPRAELPLGTGRAEDEHAVGLRLEVRAPSLGDVVSRPAFEAFEHDRDVRRRVVALHGRPPCTQDGEPSQAPTAGYKCDLRNVRSFSSRCCLIGNKGHSERSAARSSADGSQFPACGVRPHLLRLRRTGDHRDHGRLRQQPADRDLEERHAALARERLEPLDAVELRLVELAAVQTGALPAPARHAGTCR